MKDWGMKHVTGVLLTALTILGVAVLAVECTGSEPLKAALLLLACLILLRHLLGDLGAVGFSPLIG